MAGGEPRLGTTATYMRHNDHGATHLSTKIDRLHDRLDNEYEVFSAGSVKKWSKFGLRRHRRSKEARQPLVCGPPRCSSRRSLDHEGRFEGHGPGHVVEVGRGRHHRLVDIGELLLSAATLDADNVAQVLVPRRHGGIDSEEAAEIDVTISLDLQAFEGDPAHCALRYIPHHHAGVERREQMFLRIGEPVCSTQFARFIDVDREPTLHPFSADPEAFDLRTAPGLSLPGRGDPPVCLAFCGVPPDAIDQRKQIVEIDAVDDVRFGGLRLGNHDRPPLLGWWREFRLDHWSVASAAWMRWPWFSVIRLESTLPKRGCWAPEWMYCHR